MDIGLFAESNRHLENYPALDIDLGCKTLNLVAYSTGWITGTVVLSGDGIGENVMRDMQKMLNFRVNYTNLGYRNPASADYFQNGIGTSLQTGKADIAIEYLYLTIPRLQLASPLHPISMDGLSALFVQPESSVVRNIYLDPLPVSVWIIWFLALFFISLASFWIWLRKTQSNNKRVSIWRVLIDAIFLTISAMTQSGQIGDHVLNNVTWYAVSLSSQILSMSVFFVFSGRLLAVIRHPSYPIQSLEDLVNNGYTFYSPPSFQKFLSGHELFAKGVNSEKFKVEYGWNTSVQAIVDEKHARLDIRLDSAGGMQWYLRLSDERTVNQFCTMVSTISIQKSNFGFSNAFYIPKTSKLRNVLNFSILRIREAGLLKRYLNHPTLPRIRCAPSVKSSYNDENLGMSDVSFAFILSIILAFSSLVILVLEILWSNWQKVGPIAGDRGLKIRKKIVFKTLPIQHINSQTK